MQPLNYCRQALRSFIEVGASFPSGIQLAANADPQFLGYINDVYRNTAYLLKRAAKFQLPDGGRLIDDRKMRNIDPSIELGIPFESIALEYKAPKVEDIDDEMSYSKRIVLIEDKGKRSVHLSAVCYADSRGSWSIFPPISIPKIDYLDNHGENVTFFVSHSTPGLQIGDYDDEIFAMFDMLNALACRNVHVDVHRANVKGKAAKSPYPFDDYHYLTIDVPGTTCAPRTALGESHRSPREHLRRGHIRRLESGPVWVNATVVNPGVGGVIKKDYKVRMGM